MSPLVKYLGPSDRQDGTTQLEVDDVVLRKNDDEAQDISDEQLERLRELPGQRLEVEGQGAGPVFASAAARAKAIEAGIDVDEIDGSGSEGSITVGDVDKAIEEANS